MAAKVQSSMAEGRGAKYEILQQNNSTKMNEQPNLLCYYFLLNCLHFLVEKFFCLEDVTKR